MMTANEIAEAWRTHPAMMEDAARLRAVADAALDLVLFSRRIGGVNGLPRHRGMVLEAALRTAGYVLPVAEKLTAPT